jgi:hypothetical protein
LKKSIKSKPCDRQYVPELLYVCRGNNESRENREMMIPAEAGKQKAMLLKIARVSAYVAGFTHSHKPV